MSPASLAPSDIDETEVFHRPSKPSRESRGRNASITEAMWKQVMTCSANSIWSGDLSRMGTIQRRALRDVTNMWI
jgi:hypothetical protein